MAVELGELICSLLTKDDIRAMVLNLEDVHRRELTELRGALGTLPRGWSPQK